MNWSELELIWKGQNAPAATPPELEAVRRNFDARQARISRAFFQRDVKGAVILVGVSAYFAYKAWQSGPGYWPVGIAIALLLAVAGFFLRERYRVHCARVDPAAPLLAKLDADIAELTHQRRLLLNIGTWFLTPLWVAVAIILVTLFLQRPALLHNANQRLFWGGYVVACVVLNWITWAINRRCARRTVEPRIIELQRLRAHLLSSVSSPVDP